MDYTESIYFLDELKSSGSFKGAKVYKKREGVWQEITENSSTSDPALQEILGEKTLDAYAKKKLHGKMHCFFRLFSDDVIVSIEVPAKTHNTTQSAYWTELSKLKKNANHIFFANHDPLTGLLNRNGLRLNLENHLETQSNGDDHATLDGVNASKNKIVIFSFDIDHFKQVNDNHGHATGDEVLKIFSSTLRDCVEKIKKSYDGIFILSRLGGEEFELLFIGKSQRAQIEKILEMLFLAIRAPIQVKPKQKPGTNENSKNPGLPSTILCSIGIAGDRLIRGDLNQKISAIRGKSDAALLRAKKDGRNCARFYSDIRSNHGRVIEFHQDSNVVLVDIGQDVGAKLGDLYHVYYPPFTGDVEFIQNDGRSTKSLGEYIPIHSATVQVVNCQTQISTAIVIERHTTAPIPVGSLLKRIANGSTPILATPRHSGIQVGTTERFVSRLKHSLENCSFFGLLNICPKINIDYDLRPNHLSQFSAMLAAVFPATSEIFLTSGLGFNVIIKKPIFESIEIDGHGDGDEADPIEEFEQTIKDAVNRLQNSLKCMVGCYIAGENNNYTINDYYRIVYYARAALIVALSKNTDDSITSYFSANDCIYQWRSISAFGDAITDYRQFKNFGIQDDRLENQFGVTMLASENPDYFPLAELALTNAVELNSDNRIYHLNLATTKTHLSKYEEAYLLFAKHQDHMIKGKSVTAYCIAYVKVLFEMKKLKKISQTIFLDAAFELIPDGKPSTYALIYEKWAHDLSLEMTSKS